MNDFNSIVKNLKLYYCRLCEYYDGSVKCEHCAVADADGYTNNFKLCADGKRIIEDIFESAYHQGWEDGYDDVIRDFD